MRKRTAAAIGLGLGAAYIAGRADLTLQRRQRDANHTPPRSPLPSLERQPVLHTTGQPNLAPNGRTNVSRRFKISRRTTVACASLGLAIAASLGYSAWLTPDGNGPAGAKVSQAQALVVTRVNPVSQLLPGGQAAAAVHLVNNNAAPVTATSITFSGPIVSASPSSCPASNFSIVNGSPIAVSKVVPTGAAGTDLEVPNIVSAAANTPSACQGVELTLQAQVSSTF